MRKKVLTFAVAAFVAFSGLAVLPASADDSNSNYSSSNYGNSSYSDSNYGSSDYGKSYKMKKSGKSKRTVKAGNTFKLKVKKQGADLKDKHLKWTVKNKKVVALKSKDRSNDTVTLKALKPGTSKVICYNKKTDTKIVYTIKVKKAKKAYSGDSNYGNSNYGNSNYSDSNSGYGNSGYDD